MAQKRLPQRRRLGFAASVGIPAELGLAAHRSLHTLQFHVGGQSQQLPLALPPQLLQREGQQRQRIRPFALPHQALLEARFQIQPRTGRRTLNQLTEILHHDRPQRHALRLVQQLWTAVLQQRHEINAHRGQHQQPGRPQAEQLLQKLQKALRLRLLAIGISAADQ